MKHFYIIENKETFFDKNPAINMAIDEMLFEFLKKESTKIGFIIRFYTWENSYLSFGYTQRIKKKLELLKKFSNNKTQNFVRRPTGGGFVEHGNDICIAIVSNINLFPKLKKLDYSYNLIHSLILKAIKNLKKDDTDFSSMILYNSNDETININSKNQKYNFCFEKPVLNDIMLKDIKIVGSAQKRVVDKNITYLL
ncbi:MAG: hypothetical protein LBF97_04765, partial [Elusimicrobiota bacterium]|nr:hypothetical protein [Elusimicrobiota bacterium]